MNFLNSVPRTPFRSSATKTFMLIGSAALGFQLFSAFAADKAPSPMPPDDFERLYQDAAFEPSCAPLRVFHLGHSLVGRDMPFMLAQLAPDGHDYRSQLGWGTTLKAHWEGRDQVAGFQSENDHPKFEDARQALMSGRYDAFVTTEMVDLRDAIRYFESWRFLRNWAALAREHRPNIRIYLYETWHKLDEPDGWLNGLDRNLAELWEGEILRRAASASPDVFPIHVIPAGQVMAGVARAMEAGQIEGLSRREALFVKAPDGTQDPIHLSDIGNYVVALTHYAVLYGTSPIGLPQNLHRHDGTPTGALSSAAARSIQEIVWNVVSRTPRTGVVARPAPCV